MPTDDRVAVVAALREGAVALKGQFVCGSNYTFLAQVEHAGTTLAAVYKPTRGVRPLWDFASGSLARREVAAYLMSEALGWGLVPPTVYRRRGPLGPGSLQLYIAHDPEYHYFTFNEADRQRLRPAALFDLVTNNADRKGSHILMGEDRHIWLIDHGICFHVEEKLRTVIWDFSGEPLPEELRADLGRLRACLRRTEDASTPAIASLWRQISREEIAAMARRIDRLLLAGRFPNPGVNRRPYPWPPV